MKCSESGGVLLSSFAQTMEQRYDGGRPTPSGCERPRIVRGLLRRLDVLNVAQVLAA
jgi:hypothetical protein